MLSCSRPRSTSSSRASQASSIGVPPATAARAASKSRPGTRASRRKTRRVSPASCSYDIPNALAIVRSPALSWSRRRSSFVSRAAKSAAFHPGRLASRFPAIRNASGRPPHRCASRVSPGSPSEADRSPRIPASSSVASASGNGLRLNLRTPSRLGQQPLGW
ncbi:hypothetical protein ACFQX6_37500 [Streptosporangium lutulentum]